MSLKHIASKVITPVIVVTGLGLVLFTIFGDSQSATHVLLVFLPLAWLLIVVLAIGDTSGLPTAHDLIRSFYRQVDHAGQRLANDPKAADAQVLAAFDKLHEDMTALLRQRKIRMRQLKREVMQFHTPDAPAGPRWAPPSLSELGYVIAASKKFVRGRPVLALYKYSGEARSSDDAVVETYTIVKEGSSSGFSSLFEAKVRSPFARRFSAPAAASALAAAMTNIAPPKIAEAAASDRHVGYILSLLGPVTALDINLLTQNLRMLAAMPNDVAAVEALSALSVRAHLRSLLSEVIHPAEPSVAPMRSALCQEPQLLLHALPHASSAITEVATSILPAAHEHHAGFEALLREHARALQSLLPAAAVLQNPGYAYVDARGAEGDAGLLKRIAHLTIGAESLESEGPLRVFLTTNFAEADIRSQLQEFLQLNPGADDQSVIATLIAALDTRQVIVNHVEGSVPIRIDKKAAAALQGKHGHGLILSANPALVELESADAGLEYVLWTLGSQALTVPVENIPQLTGQAQKIRRYAQAVAAAALQIETDRAVPHSA